jgi:hypothetical protein
MRYFIVTYHFYTKNKNWGIGSSVITSPKYPRRKFVLQEAINDTSEITEIAITNIIELSEEDYESYNS